MADEPSGGPPAPGPDGTAADRGADPVEVALVERARHGDSAAFGELVTMHQAAAFRVAYVLTGSTAEAEDAAQEAFVQAYRARATFRADGSPDAWMARIATREAWRRRSRGKRRAAATLPIDDALGELLVDLSDPVAETLLAERGEAVRDAVAALPEPYREVVMLRYFGDLSPAAIASVTSRPEGTVRAQLSRGLGRLRIRLGSFRP